MLKKCERGAGARRPYPVTTRERVVAAIRTDGMTRSQAAGHFGIPASTIYGWLHRPGEPVSSDDLRGWSPARREAAARIHDNPTVAPGDWAAMLGWPAGEAAALAARCGIPTPRGKARAPGWDTAELARRLGRHVARQIAALDAALAGRDADADTARILRDVAGLKRLLDALETRGRIARDAGRREAARGHDGDGSDPAALRATIARRVAAFEADGPAGTVPGDPAADPA